MLNAIFTILVMSKHRARGRGLCFNAICTGPWMSEHKATKAGLYVMQFILLLGCQSTELRGLGYVECNLY